MDRSTVLNNPTAGELSTRALRALLTYFSSQYGERCLEEAVRKAKLGNELDVGYLYDENNWVSFNVGQRLIDTLDEEAEDPNFVEKAGLSLASKENLGMVFSAFKSYGNPKICYQNLFPTLPLYNRVGFFEILDISDTFLRFRYTSRIVEPNRRFSDFRMNQLASLPTIWKLPPAKARRTRYEVLIEEGGAVYEYEFRWERLHSYRPVVTGTLLGVAPTLATLNAFPSPTPLLLAACGAAIGGLAGKVISDRRRIRDQEQILRDQTDDLLQSVTEIQTRYDEVQALNVSLEQKVEARTAELTVANTRLTELDKLKDRFLANISHELRTPLVALSSTLQMILNGDGDPALHRTLLTNGAGALEDMLENVNDLLLKSRSDRGMIEARWSELEIGDFARRALKVFSPLARRKGLELRFESRLDGELPLYADRPKLKKIINNLVGNALKYTDRGTVAITLDREEGWCRLSVEDSGRGIPADELDTIFQPFFQASNNPHREVQGAGIGLSLVRDLVQLHHGEIEVDSRLDQGSRFTVRLPLGHDHVDWERLDDSPLTEESDHRVDLRLRGFEDLDLTPFSDHRDDRHTVLLVEDNPQIVQVLGYLLRGHYNLHFARDGEEGLARVRAIGPDLIISDIMMPRMNGYELLAAVRREPRLKGIPFILLTSKADRLSRLHGFEEGADEYLTKPFNNEEVLIRVRGLIQRKRLEIEFAHLEKMVALGQLAAGVGHEINNPIAFATSAAQTVEKVFAAVEEGRIDLAEGMSMMRGALERIREGTTRVAEITEALRGFVRQGAKGFQPYDIHPAIDATLTILDATHKAEVRFIRRYELDEKVECNINQLNQVILNLAKNAAQAINGRDDAEIVIHTARDGDRARIVVEDNGPGIRAELLGRIFDPFFTTNALGSGTGLGLHICRQIIDEHQGTLTARNRETGGARFTIQLPLRQEGTAPHGGFTHPHADRRLEAIHYPHRG